MYNFYNSIQPLVERLNKDEWEDELGNIKFKKLDKLNLGKDNWDSKVNIADSENWVWLLNLIYTYLKNSKIDSSHNPKYEKIKGNIFKWILKNKLHKTKRLFGQLNQETPEDIVKIKDAFEVLLKHNVKINWNTLTYKELIELKNEHSKKVDEREEALKKFENHDMVKKIGNFKVVKATKKLTSNDYLNKGFPTYNTYRQLTDKTEWCTSAKNMFDMYTKYANLFVIIKNNDFDNMYQFLFDDSGESQFMDKMNEDVEPVEHTSVAVVHYCIKEEKKEGRLKSHKLIDEGWVMIDQWYNDYAGGRLSREEILVNGKLKSINDKPSVVSWYESRHGDIEYEEWHENGALHRDGNGDEDYAAIRYYKDGTPKRKQWYKNGELHRDGDGDEDYAVIEYNEDGSVVLKTWFEHGKLHRDKKPAHLEYYEDGSLWHKEWHKKGIQRKQIVYNKDGSIKSKFEFDKEGTLIGRDRK